MQSMAIWNRKGEESLIAEHGGRAANSLDMPCESRIVAIDLHETKISNVCSVKFESVHVSLLSALSLFRLADGKHPHTGGRSYHEERNSVYLYPRCVHQSPTSQLQHTIRFLCACS